MTNEGIAIVCCTVTTCVAIAGYVVAVFLQDRR